jgi:hypothetical protein
VNGGWSRAAGAEEIVRPRRLIGRFWAAPQLHGHETSRSYRPSHAVSRITSRACSNQHSAVCGETKRALQVGSTGDIARFDLEVYLQGGACVLRATSVLRHTQPSL